MNTNVISVVLKDANGRLRSGIFASRADLVQTSPTEHETGIAVKATIGQMNEGDFVVRSVKSGKFRKMVVLAGQVPVEIARSIDGYAATDENEMNGDQPRATFRMGDFIVLTEGQTVVPFPAAVQAA